MSGSATPSQNVSGAPKSRTGGRADGEGRRTATRAELLEMVHATCPAMSRQQARDVFEAALEEISLALARGESVRLRAFGLFSVREKRARIGRNPRTGEEAPISQRRVLTFKPSTVLLGTLNS